MEFASLAQQYSPVDLGQGYPNLPPPRHVLQALADVALSEDPGVHQYADTYVCIAIGADHYYSLFVFEGHVASGTNLHKTRGNLLRHLHDLLVSTRASMK